MRKFKKKTKLVKKQALVCLAFALAVVIASGTNVALAEWREPEGPPPQGYFYPPLTTSGEHQAKEGKLKIDPQYNPTDENSLSYPIDRTLDIEGVGALFLTPNVYTNLLTVDNTTLFADAYNDWVGVGTDERTLDIVFKVDGGTVQVAPADGVTVQAVSSNGPGIYGDAGATGEAGICGYNSGFAGLAVLGESQNNVGVRGESPSGYGIYATTQAADQGAVYASNAGTGWAAYFDGMLGAGYDVVSDRFLPTNLQKSLIPFTSGQEVNVYDFGNWEASFPEKVRLTFDGTYVWLGTDVADTSGYNFYKIRASDGVTVKSYTVGTGYEAITFDGTYVWLSSDIGGDIYRFNPVSGSTDSVSGIGANIKYSLTASSVGGQVYIWATDLTGNKVVKINATSLYPEPFDLDLVATGASAPYQLTFDGEYVWVATQSNHIIRLWAEDPNDAGHPVIILDMSASCSPENIFFDGVYIWCLQGASGQLKRIWAEDPSDIQHPIEDFGPTVTNNMDMAFDGTYLWVVNSANKFYRYLAADPLQYDEFDLTFQPERIVFDSTYLWVPEADGVSVPKLHKYYSGTGMGHTDLNTVVNLRTNTGFCSVTTTQECIFDWQCPGGESCGAGHTSQAGNINITGSAEINSQCLAKDGWTHNGVRVNDPIPREPDGDFLKYPQAVEDGTGEGVIVVWLQRDTDYNIYAQRIRVNNGTSLWGEDKVIMDPASYVSYPMIVRASDGYFIITWADERGGDYDIYAQKIDINGNPQWVVPGVRVSDAAAASHQLYPQLVADASGGAYIIWEDRRNNVEIYDDDIYMQRIDTNGNLWANDVVVASEANRQSEFQLAYLSSTGDVMVTWTDCRDADNPQDCPLGLSNVNVYYQRINSSGSPVYAATPPGSYGVLLSDGTHATKNDADTPLMVVSDDIGGSQGVIIAHTRGGSSQKNIHGIKSSDGTVQWDVSVNNCSEYGSEHFQHAIPDGNDGMIFVWGGLIRRIDKDGNLYWENTCHGLKFTDYSTSYQTQRLVSDGDGGAIIAWVDRRPTWTEGTSYLYAQKVLKDGSIVWDDNGFRILDLAGSSTGGVYPEYYHVVSDGSGGGIVVWVDERNGITGDGRHNDVYAQRVMDCLQAGDVRVGADLDVLGNLWGGSDVTVSVSGGTAECPNSDDVNEYYGYFIKGITLDSESEISEIVCRGL